MKKTIKSLFAIAIAAFAFTACSDVPEPYQIPGQGGGGEQGSEIYTSANFKTGWTLKAVTAEQPWSQGSKYVQATGYQDWGSGTKSNKAVEGWLVSPTIKTVGYENVKFSFDNTIKYTNNVSGWEANHKVFATSNYNESDINASTWVELDFTPKASPYSDWTLYSSGEIQLPASMVGQEAIRIAFWFKAPANASTTWELMNLKVEQGIANNEQEEPTPSEAKVVTIAQFLAAEVSSTDEYQLTGTIKNLKDGDQYGNFDIEDATGSVYVYGLLAEKGGSKGKFQELVAAKGIANGKKITLIGNRAAYKESPQVGNAYFVSIEGEGDTPTPSVNTDGTEAKPYTVPDAITVGSGTNVYVKAYIVGWIDGKTLSEGAKFNADATVATNIIIAATPDETDISKCMPVQLPSGAVRTAVNLQDNAGNYKKEILMVGNIEKYFGATGVKGVSYAKIGETEAGTKPSGGGDTPTPSGNHGTATAPLTVAQAIALIDAESNISEAYVKGKISQIDSYNATYKSITYWISDDGGTTTQLQVYSGKGLNGADFTAKEDLTVGQTVVIKGALKKYGTTYEFDKTSSIISIDGAGGGGNTPTPSGNHGTEAAPLTVAQAIALIDAESTISEAYVKGKISQIDSYNEKYKSITYWISDDGTTTTQLQVYSGKGLNGADFSAKEDLTVGKTVVIKGALKKYNTTYEFDKTSSILSIE